MKYLLTLVPFLAMYLLSAFAIWDWNPGNWDTFGRFILGCLSILCAAVIAIAIATESDD